jgi:ubiquinone/menaquinone biosynthesis C-methylase UbiE
MKFRDSKIAHKYLDGLNGVEIGGSAHNPFNLNTINVDFTDELTIYKKEEINLCGEYMKVDVVSDALNLPFENEKYDFVISSHQIEHCFNIIDTIREYIRVIKNDGYVLLIAPKPEVVKEDRPVLFNEFLSRVGTKNNGDGGHCSVCSLKTIKEIFKFLDLKVIEALKTDDKVGNGWLIIGKK